MGILKITAKGQVTFRKDLLEHMGVGPGEQVSVEMLPDGRIVVQAAPSAEISSVFGMLKGAGRRRLSVKDMNEIAREGWSGRRQP
ncbi:MAG: AbrB/MazE/SpoVT family DNA-binding domain-containing protein [Hyphomonas sp.]|uniref:AbrB/MazE/SpoVT family DNA-binding domain-containing protein n=1 Tax=Hyphomonas sp. TaxID=87 RepID=UPI0017CA8071|nr:AbrB/MazE/SpoVT family DNA-binding domain-containing protein [Hyphomonas sp.]MBA3069467.1 AbrB/MazE/SpoVT family DNA-binding domain-containing protein [Hyphomonas sp.]MBU3919441.1 AbrB/MazE/SpoVT family DNA-binding domain-containing protein [Alphaproteobacteria bacterium]MBU4063849.1 AbrB/MazE/SpoVT family DNA-binding domain-containing protein [Alphaproteobacteria bacterium]MBU4164190.1 AbrB/MazE/SpoVT family DNA-binding domain-containing protein [Alphaproteobacteria bacterium]